MAPCVSSGLNYDGYLLWHLEGVKTSVSDSELLMLSVVAVCSRSHCISFPLSEIIPRLRVSYVLVGEILLLVFSHWATLALF